MAMSTTAHTPIEEYVHLAKKPRCEYTRRSRSLRRLRREPPPDDPPGFAPLFMLCPFIHLDVTFDA